MFRRLFLVFALLGMAAPAGAQQPAPSPGPTPLQPQMLRVARISPWLDPDHPFIAVVQITNTTELPLENVRVRISVFGRVVTRSGLTQALDHGASTPFVGSGFEPVEGTIEAGGQRTVVVRRAARDLAQFGRTGVYPVQITLVWSGGSAYVFTAQPYLAGDIPTQLNMSLLLPVVRPALARADGIAPTDAIQLANAATLAQQMNVIAKRASVAVTLAPSPSTLDELASMTHGFPIHSPTTVTAQGPESAPARAAAAALEAVKKAAAVAGEIATVPYAQADLPSLGQHGLRADLLRQLTLGRSVAQTMLGRAPSLAAFAPPLLHVDRDTLVAARSLGVSGAVASASALAFPPTEPFQPQNFGPSRPVSVDLGTEPKMPVLLADADLSARAASQEQGVLAGQSVVALSAIAWLELPLFAPERVLLVAPAALPSPPAFAAMVDGLAGAPWVRLRTVGDALTSLPPQSQTSLARVVTPDASYLAAARAAGRAVSTLNKIVTTPPPEVETLDRHVLLSESAEWAGAPLVGAALARSVSARVRAITRAVRVPPRQVTLTSRRGNIPITIVNENDFPLSVRVRLESSKVAFTGGETRTIELAPPNQTVDFAIEARATGAFPIDVHVESPDGRTQIASGRLIVRSTAVSAVALAAVGTGVVLLLFGSARRGRRRKNAAAR